MTIKISKLVVTADACDLAACQVHGMDRQYAIAEASRSQPLAWIALTGGRTPRQVKMLTHVRTPGGVTECLIAGEGPPLILLHGAGRRASAWNDVIPQLACDYQVMTPDIPGHGGSSAPGALYTRHFYASWLRRFVLEMRLSRPCIVGHSLGGAIALASALQQPDLIDRLVLVNSIGLGAPAPRASLLLLAVLRSFG